MAEQRVQAPPSYQSLHFSVAGSCSICINPANDISPQSVTITQNGQSFTYVLTGSGNELSIADFFKQMLEATSSRVEDDSAHDVNEHSILAQCKLESVVLSKEDQYRAGIKEKLVSFIKTHIGIDEFIQRNGIANLDVADKDKAVIRNERSNQSRVNQMACVLAQKLTGESDTKGLSRIQTLFANCLKSIGISSDIRIKIKADVR